MLRSPPADVGVAAVGVADVDVAALLDACEPQNIGGAEQKASASDCEEGEPPEIMPPCEMAVPTKCHLSPFEPTSQPAY
jgi:hypothetical protein